MIGVVLDAVALLALARNERSIWAALKLAVAQGSDVIVPSTALARVRRGTGAQAQLAKALQFCVVASFASSPHSMRLRGESVSDARVARPMTSAMLTLH